jgi:hypothetical protein
MPGTGRGLATQPSIMYHPHMPSIVGKRRGRHTSYSLVESVRVDGQPRIVSQGYLGTAEEVMAKLTGASAGAPVRSQHDQVVPRYANAAASVGTYLALATANRTVDPGSKLAFADWWASTAAPRWVKGARHRAGAPPVLGRGGPQALVRSEGDLLVGGSLRPGWWCGWLGFGWLGFGVWLEAAGRVPTRARVLTFALELEVDVVLADRAGAGVGQVTQLQRGQALVAAAQRAGPHHLSGHSLLHGPAALVAQHMVVAAGRGEAGVHGGAAAGVLDQVVDCRESLDRRVGQRRDLGTLR